MNGQEHTLIVCMEECSEIQTAISKGLRFGLDNHHPLSPELTNGKDIMTEFYQLCAVMELAMESGLLPVLTTSERHLIMCEKRQSLVAWSQYSKDVGCINDEKV